MIDDYCRLLNLAKSTICLFQLGHRRRLFVVQLVFVRSIIVVCYPTHIHPLEMSGTLATRKQATAWDAALLSDRWPKA